MVVWTDAHLSPALVPWLRAALGVDAATLRDLGLRDAEDTAIFAAARATGAVLMTKDSDFAALRAILGGAWPRVAELLAAGEPLVEISGRSR